MQRFLVFMLLALLLTPLSTRAAAPAPAHQAATIRQALVQAQLLFAEPQQATLLVEQAQAAYSGPWVQTLAAADPAADARVREGLAQAQQAIATNDALLFADSKAQIWSGLLAGSSNVVSQHMLHNNAAGAREWLILREFRQVTRFSRPNTDATAAIEDLISGEISGTLALERVQADLLDTYQARLVETLHEVRTAHVQGFAVRRAEEAALAHGYFAMLAPAYTEQRGPAALQQLDQLFRELRTAARNGAAVIPLLDQLEAELGGFRAAPLTLDEQARRATQLRHFLQLVPVEYERGVRNGKVVHDFEIREAITFRDGAAAAFADLHNLITERDAEVASSMAQELGKLETMLSNAARGGEVVPPAQVEATSNAILESFVNSAPEAWLQANIHGDFDMISTILDEMESAVASGQYDMAESARLQAYAVMELGPEAKLTAFAPHYIPIIEGLFWFGQGEHSGLARLIEAKAPAAEIRASRAALDRELAQAQKALGGQAAPTAVALNAALIVFREGLEAVLILASLMASFRGANQHLRRPLWWGAGLAFAATILTWFLAQGVLASLARYGERLEAVVSLIAIGVLLLITNWFFHKVYWTGWIASFHARKRRLVKGSLGQWIGLAMLGVTSIYREGFETVLFLQALVLEAGVGAVLGGVGIGLGATFCIGVLVFALQARLPYKKMLIFTGILIGAVLLIMVGNTVHVLQVVGWLPLHPIRAISLPYWAGMWLGLYPTWEGIALQVCAAVFVIGSYCLAQYVQKNKTATIVKQQQAFTKAAH